MKYKAFKEFASATLDQLKKNSTYKIEYPLTSPQDVRISITDKPNLLNFCSNNYLGLCNNSQLKETAKQSLDKWGFGMSSVRFICGTTNSHLELEKKVSQFYETEDTILFSSCFDANEAVFEALLTNEDAIISDKLNHASIINGIKLSKATRYLYENNNLNDLEAKLIEAKNARFKIIVTDGVFSMDGVIANVAGIANLAEKYGAIFMIDECHGTGVIGARGRGAIEFTNSIGSAELISSTFGKALGGGNGGFITGKQEIISMLRQKGRPYLFSNTLPVHIVETYIEALNILDRSPALLQKLAVNIKYFRTEMIKLGFTILGNPSSAICPVLLKSEEDTVKMAKRLQDMKIFVIGFTYPVVGKGLARIRVQISAAHELEDVKTCVKAFEEVGREMKLIN